MIGEVLCDHIHCNEIEMEPFIPACYTGNRVRTSSKPD